MGREGTEVVLSRASWTLLRADRRLAPIAAAGLAAGAIAATTTVTAVTLSLRPTTRLFGSAYRTTGFGLPDAGGPPSSVTTLQPTALTYALVVVGYLLVVVLATLTSAALVVVAQRRLHPNADARIVTNTETVDADAVEPTRSVVWHVARRSPQLVSWALISGTLGMLHRVIEKRPVLGLVAGRVNGLSWRSASWLVVPVILADGTGPMQSLRRSADLHVDTWGIDAIPRTGLACRGTALVALAGVTGLVLLPRGTPPALLAGGAVAVVGATIVASLSALNRAALWSHATGVAVPDIDADTLAAAFASRNRSVAVRLTTEVKSEATGRTATAVNEDLPPLTDATIFEVEHALTDAVAMLPRRERLRLRPAGYRRPRPVGQPVTTAEPIGSASLPSR